MPNYRRHFVKGGCYFFTVTLADRRLSLLTEYVDLLRKSFQYTQQRHPFHINAIVVLPEHLHCIWTLPENDHDYSTRWRLIKTMFSRGIPFISRARDTPAFRHG
ncbi:MULTISPECIES: REP-associated tyrosine transposase [Thiothrix]|uniref:REP-associated tyrosine transposase n=1 Tax=Thiothrix TaxID=1030 RepID=UPI0027E55755|nr:transposase [Thiothrix lacustris]WMP17236.1 transposase [Thiothrix lacustris]